MTKIKLCGIKRAVDTDYLNAVMPDYAGFVFAEKSKRYVAFDEAAILRKRLNKGIIPVGVFVDEKIENIKMLFARNVIEAVQLHGSEDNEYIKKLRSTINCPVIKAFRIETEKDINRAQLSAADYIMLDSGGGTGKTFNHMLIKEIKRDFFLAGGLNYENVCDAVNTYCPFAVDASSSLETDGVKDINKITAFVNAVRYGKEEKI